MKKYPFLLLLLCFGSTTFAISSSYQTSFADSNAVTTIILVRHAERAEDGSRDPDLSIYGIVRANRLAQLLHIASVDAIYSTPFKRTRQTVHPLALALGLEIQDYAPLDLEAFDDLIDSQQGKTVLLSGHSNTVPAIVNHLLGEEKLGQLGEGEYDRVFIVTLIGDTAHLVLLSY